MTRTLLLFAFLFSTSLMAQQNSPDGIQTNKTIQQVPLLYKSQTPIWSEDFANGFPASWSTYTNNASGGIATCPWKHSFVGSWGYWNSNQGTSPSSAINSTTAANGFLISDPDSANHWNYGQPSGTTYEYMESYFTTNAIDLSGYPNVSLEFQQTFRFNNGLNLKVSISTDSVMWTDYNVQGNATNNTQSPDPQFVSLNISAIAGNDSTVYIRIGWEARVYYWMIDDMQIIETPANRLELLEANHGGWYTTPTTQGYALGYKFYPINQAIANPYKFEGVVANLGALTQNTRLNVEAIDDIGTSVFSSTSNDTLLATMDTNIFLTNNAFTPTNTGLYNFYTWSTSDSTQTDTINTSSIVTDSIYGRDFDNYQSYWRVGRNCGGMVLGTYYDVYDTDNLTSISAYVSPISVPGAEIYAAVYEIDAAGGLKIWLSQSDNYTIQTADLDNWVTFEIPGGINLQAGTTYMAAIGGYAHPIDTSAIGVSGEAWSSTCYIQDNGCNIGSQAFGDWYWISKVPMIRMNFGNVWTTGVSDNDFGKNISVYPNPTSDKFTIELNNNKAEKISISIKSVLGKTIFMKQQSIAIDAKQVIDISPFAKGIYLLEITNDDGRFSEQLIVE
ncbi:MAG: T9SS type A sorting domain-containing protein [Bacteroidota bacterium]|nr:T9SS type A sorting domain-containing protein [Bacteroidota bacterium]